MLVEKNILAVAEVQDRIEFLVSDFLIKSVMLSFFVQQILSGKKQTLSDIFGR